MSNKEFIFYAKNILIFSVFFLAIYTNMSLMPSVFNNREDKMIIFNNYFGVKEKPTNSQVL